MNKETLGINFDEGMGAVEDRREFEVERSWGFGVLKQTMSDGSTRRKLVFYSEREDFPSESVAFELRAIQRGFLTNKKKR